MLGDVADFWLRAGCAHENGVSEPYFASPHTGGRQSRGISGSRNGQLVARFQF